MRTGSPEGEPYCIDFIMEGLEFKEDGVVYSSFFEENSTYYLEKTKRGTALYIKTNRHYLYYIDRIKENAIGNHDPNIEFCYLERK